MRLSLDSRTERDLGIVSATGEIDLASVPALREAISEHIVAGRSNLLVDLTAVTFLDSTGLGVLVGAAKKANGGGGCLRLVCDNERVLRLLRITGLDRAIAVHPSVASAVAAWPVALT